MFAMAHEQFIAARPLFRSRADFYYSWGVSSFRFSRSFSLLLPLLLSSYLSFVSRSILLFSISGFIERESKDLPFAFTLSIFSGFLFERALSLRVEYIGAWTRWGKVVDMLLYLYPTNPQVKQMIAIFLTSYRSLLLQKKTLSPARDDAVILDSLSLKPLVALALSR
jgi:hypothetical protein